MNNDPTINQDLINTPKLQTQFKRKPFTNNLKKVIYICSTLVGILAFTTSIFVGVTRIKQTQNFDSQASIEQLVDNNLGTFISPKAITTASASHKNFPASYAIDNNKDTFWNSGNFPEQWIQLDFGKTIEVSAVRLLINQFPAGHSKHIILAGENINSLKKVHIFEKETDNNQWLVYKFPKTIQNARYIRIHTEKSKSWVSWKEVQVYEAKNEPNADSLSKITDHVWDNGLSKRCIVTGNRSTWYKETSECEQGNSNHWQLGFQSEQGYGASNHCNEFSGINTLNTPLSLNFLERGNNTYAVNMEIDLINNEHPCGDNHFNWFVFMHQNPASRYPLPSKLLTKHTVFYTKDARNGVARLIAGMSGFVRNTPTAQVEGFTIEVGLNVDDGWGDMFPNSPLISKCTFDVCGSNHIFIDGNYFDISVDDNVETVVTIPWYKIYNYLINENHIPKPYQVSPAYLSTGGVSLGFEVNNYSAKNSYKANLLHSDFLVLETE